jgi:hypothetical protein
MKTPPFAKEEYLDAVFNGVYQATRNFFNSLTYDEWNQIMAQIRGATIAAMPGEEDILQVIKESALFSMPDQDDLK